MMASHADRAQLETPSDRIVRHQIMNTNPYQPPRTIESASMGGPIDSADRVRQIALLPLTPWRLRRVLATTPHRWACMAGYVGLTIQFGLAIAPDFGSIGEPYRNVAQCIQESVYAAWICLVLGSLVSVLPLSIALVLKHRWSKSFMLGCWAILPAFVPWLICRFCYVLNRPSYGIITNDRPDWMTNSFALMCGMNAVWLSVLSSILVLALVFDVRGVNRPIWKS